MTILVACGLKREAAIMARAGFVGVAGGGDAARLERALRTAIAGGGVYAVLSSGLAGALDPALQAGDLVIGQAAPPGEGRGPASEHPQLDPGLRRGGGLAKVLLDQLQGAVHGAIVGSDSAVASVAAKRDLFAATSALAVDMESHIAARVAAEHGLPFAILRAISDDARHALPRAALVGMRPDGGMAVGAVIAALARDPRQLPALLRTARGAEAGFKALARAYDVLGRARIGLADLG